MKNYNLEWLKGYNITDKEHAELIKVDVPEELFGTPEYNTFVLDKIYEENVRDFKRTINKNTGEYMTDEEAMAEAGGLRDSAQSMINSLLNKKDK